jgi:Starch-binding associating with outer membrane/Susd and RagB outer membrane lipoprotein
MKRNIFKLLLVITIVGFTGCETVDLDQTENPSTLNQSFIDPVYTFNYVQLQLPQFVNSTNSFAQEVTRQMAMTGGNTYDNAYAPINFDNNWFLGYNILNAIKIMEPKAIANRKYFEQGASKIIGCYVLMTLVDMYGDIPYAEALQGNNNLAPKFDSSASVYTSVLTELDNAIAILTQPLDSGDNTFTDLYYAKDKTKWITLAKTLKLKMYNNSRLAGAGNEIGVPDIGAAISQILNEGDIIDTPEEDFAFKYGNSRFTPNTRHPLYNDQYEAGGGAYIGNYMMWAMSTEKGFSTDYNSIGDNDPRLHFYFYKQKADPNDFNLDTFTLPGRSRPSHYNNDEYNSFYLSSSVAKRFTPYVVSNWSDGSTSTIPKDGFWGRDHGDNSGIPLDADKRTVGGVYPIGGVSYEADNTVQTGGTKGLKGQGIMPILLSSFVHFIKAEAILTLGVAGDARQEFLDGINSSIDKSTKIDVAANYPKLTAPQLSNLNSNKTFYPNFMLEKYDVASADDKLQIIIKEYYLAAWGNGIEPYNNYRRTGYPTNFQPTLQPTSGNFYSTALYPQGVVNNNPNTPANNRTRKVFWDKANVQLH